MPISETEARALYDSGASVAEVARAMEMDARAFLRHRKKHGWPLRPSPVRSAKPASKPSVKPKTVRAKKSRTRPKRASAASTPSVTTPADLAPADIPAVRRQIEAAVQANLARVQTTLASGDTDDIERNARLLASLVKSLAELRRLEALDPRSGETTGAADGHKDERRPRDIDTLRDELARALERMSVEPARPQDSG